MILAVVIVCTNGLEPNAENCMTLASPTMWVTEQQCQTAMFNFVSDPAFGDALFNTNSYPMDAKCIDLLATEPAKPKDPA